VNGQSDPCLPRSCVSSVFAHSHLAVLSSAGVRDPCARPPAPVGGDAIVLGSAPRADRLTCAPYRSLIHFWLAAAYRWRWSRFAEILNVGRAPLINVAITNLFRVGWFFFEPASPAFLGKRPHRLRRWRSHRISPGCPLGFGFRVPPRSWRMVCTNLAQANTAARANRLDRSATVATTCATIGLFRPPVSSSASMAGFSAAIGSC